MAEKKSLVEETLLQMKELENVISENAKGILASTMKQEIGELVKESLMEQAEDDDDLADDDDVTANDDVIGTDDATADDDDAMADDDDAMADDDDAMADDDDAMADDDDAVADDDDLPIDLTGASDEEILKVFKGMGEEDGIIIKKDGNTIDLEDTEEDVEYKIQLGESDDFNDDGEFVFGDDDFTGGDMGDEFSEEAYESLEEEEEEEEEEETDESLEEEIVYEIELGEGDGITSPIDSDITLGEGDGITSPIDSDIALGESGLYDEDYNEVEFYEETLDELDAPPDEVVQEGFKAKGLGFGKSKFKYPKKPNQQGGFKEKMKQGPKSVGTGSAKKFKFSDGENSGSKLGKNKIVKKSETKEASRTLGSGKFWGRPGLPKPKSSPRHIRLESQDAELNLLREKNEEYRKALNLFRGKLNEVAVFNSNLAYATRLFTEHSTTKQEKINILRRFDSVETLKESKSLYKTIKDELSSQPSAKPSKESIQEQIERTPSSGSATSLIESKTYENPQFMRMKDLMVKMNIKN